MQPNAIWSYDFVHDQIVDGRSLKLPCVIDEHTRECLAIEAGTSQRSHDVNAAAVEIDAPVWQASVDPLRQWRGVHRGEGNALVARCNIGPAFIAPGSRWQNGYVESLNSKLRDEL